MLSRLWFSFFFLSFIACLYQWWALDNSEIYSVVIKASFDMAKLAVEISIGLIGVMCLWLGLFKVAEASGLIGSLAKLLSPLFARLMPEIPKGHPAIGSVTMNLSANLLGLDNAATPMGLKAMQDMQALNTNKLVASNPQILFLVLNTSSVTLLPITVFLYRAQLGAAEPTAVFLPIILATTASTLVGVLTVGWIQKLRLFNWVVLSYLFGLILFVSTIFYAVHAQPPDEINTLSNFIGNFVLFSVIVGILGVGVTKGVQVYEVFVDGAKEGVSVCVTIVPYLVAMLVGIGVLRASGLLDLFVDSFAASLVFFGINADFVPALPTALMKPFSGSGSRAMMIETMNNYGVDSFPAKIAAIVQGSTETTFYVLAVYFGSVGIRHGRHAVFCGLVADFAGISAAILLGYWFFY
ncbi:MAG: spore maturation protein [Gammaproteobacteria bacterium]|nr:spore maturation protein [Gammaproteobacteria bacterium]